MGRLHAKKGINNQDAVATKVTDIDGKPCFIGIVCDGCSLGHNPKSSRNEVGSALLAAFALSEIELLLQAHMPVEEIVRTLFGRCISYLSNVARLTVSGDAAAHWNFVQTHLLTTIRGFIAFDGVLVTFGADDGVVIVNGDISVIDQGNMPLYLGYHLLDRKVIATQHPNLVLPQEFDVRAIPLDTIDTFAIATDGLAAGRSGDGTAKAVREKDHIGIFDHEPDQPIGLQWHLNFQSNYGEGFEDDCTVITLVRQIGGAP